MKSIAAVSPVLGIWLAVESQTPNAHLAPEVVTPPTAPAPGGGSC